MRLSDRHAFFTRVLGDGRVVDVRPWRLGMATLVVSAGLGAWTTLATYWYPTPQAAVEVALEWDGEGAPAGAEARPRLR